jgi:hypothetical protein
VLPTRHPLFTFQPFFSPTLLGATHFLEHLKTLHVNSLALPNFGHHLIRDNSQDEYGADAFDAPMRVISAFLCNIPNLQLSDFVSSYTFFLLYPLFHPSYLPNHIDQEDI